MRPQEPAQALGPKVYDLERFPKLNDILASTSGSLNQGDVQYFWDNFCRHQEDLVSCIRTGEYDSFEAHVSLFTCLMVSRDSD
jgi:hypothetical protein